jgi:hypothetical protein
MRRDEVAQIELDPLVDRVKDAFRDADLPKRPQLPSFDEFAKDLRKVDAGSAVDQLAKAIERIDIPKAIERIELPPVIEQRLPGRKKRRAPIGLIGVAVIASLALATLALFPPLRRQLRTAFDGLRAQIDGIRGERHWSRGAGFPVAFPESETAPLQDDPAIPGSPAPYPEGLGREATLDDPLLDRPLTETPR